MEVKIFCDGGSRGNPGPAASAFVVYDSQGVELYKKGIYIGVATNNQAEYGAVVAALEWLSMSQNKDITRVNFVLDSELVVRQLTGVYKIKNKNILPLAQKAISAIKSLQAIITFTHVLRSKNVVADALVNHAIDSANV
jgi:ribonuclease HI